MDYGELVDYQSIIFMRRRTLERRRRAIADVDHAVRTQDLQAWRAALARLAEANRACEQWGIRT